MPSKTRSPFHASQFSTRSSDPAEFAQLARILETLNLQALYSSPRQGSALLSKYLEQFALTWAINEEMPDPVASWTFQGLGLFKGHPVTVKVFPSVWRGLVYLLVRKLEGDLIRISISPRSWQKTFEWLRENITQLRGHDPINVFPLLPTEAVPVGLKLAKPHRLVVVRYAQSAATTTKWEIKTSSIISDVGKTLVLNRAVGLICGLEENAPVHYAFWHPWDKVAKSTIKGVMKKPLDLNL